MKHTLREIWLLAKRPLRYVAGGLLVLIGLIGLVMPIMPGWVLLIPGLTLLLPGWWIRRQLHRACEWLERHQDNWLGGLLHRGVQRLIHAFHRHDPTAPPPPPKGSCDPPPRRFPSAPPQAPPSPPDEPMR